MSNDTAKGNRLQRLAATLLEADGYLCHVTVRTSQFRMGHWCSQSNDIWNAFDIISTRLGEPPRYIQVTTMSNVSARIKKVDSVPLDLRFSSVEVWGWKGGQVRKHKTTGEFLDRQYFQIYYKYKDWKPDPADKIRK